MDFSDLCIELTLNNQLLNVNRKSLESAITFKAFFCGPSWARTNDPLIMSQML